MKIIKQAWETRYKELAIQLDCSACGTRFEAEGKEDDFTLSPSMSTPLGNQIVAKCPYCTKIISVDNMICEKDKDLYKFIHTRLKPQN